MMLRRNRRWLLSALVALVVSSLTVPAQFAATVARAATRVVANRAATARAVSTVLPSTVTVDGHGWGHGVGLSQYGALGYAVDYGWTAAQILDHYYGTTVASTAPSIDMTVRLYSLDGAPTAVVQDKSALVIDGYTATPDQPATWRSLVASETAEGHYRVWGRSDASVCPSAGLDLDDPANGWTIVISDQPTSVTFRPQVDTSASVDVGDLVGLCEPATGRVRYYRGAIRAINSNTQANRTVNQVPLEQYLRSVVGGEVSWAWGALGEGKGMQALQAQAVAARSYGLAENKDTYAKTCDAVNCQTYRGAAYRSGVSGTIVAQEFAATDAAVVATSGVVRRYGSELGAIAYTMFSSSSGGYTAQTSLGFTPVVDQGDAVAGNAAHTWSATILASSIQSAWPSIGDYSGVVVDSRQGNGEWGGRVVTMTVKGSAGSVSISGDQFRAALGLKSSWFQVRGDGPAVDPVGPCVGRSATPVAGAGANSAPSRFTALSPTRLIDTRSGLGTSATPLDGGCTLTIDPNVAGDATAVVVNVTSVNPVINGFLTAYPCGAERPLASIVPSLVGRIVPGTAVVPLNSEGNFCLFSSTTTDLVVDLTGVYETAAGQRFQPVPPQRRFDSRGRAMLPAGAVVRVQIAGAKGVPSDATAAAVTVHSMNAVGAGYVTIWPCDDSRPTTSVLNATAGSAVTNHAQVGLDSTGGLCMFAAQAMHLVLDVGGWFGPSATTDFHALMPQRVLDTRENVGLVGRFGVGQNRALVVTGIGEVPSSGVAAIAAEVTSVGAARPAFITVHPCMAPVPNLSMVRNFANSVAANSVVAGVDARGRLCLKASSAMDILIDVSGWYGANL